MGTSAAAYQVTVAYKKREDNPTDYMSRHPEKLTTPTSRQQRVAEEFVDYISNISTQTALKLEDIATARPNPSSCDECSTNQQLV